jgi:hypothetical protein
MARFAFHCRDKGTVLKMHSNWLVKAMALNPPTSSLPVDLLTCGPSSRHAAFVAGGSRSPVPLPSPVGDFRFGAQLRTHRCAVRRSTTAGENLLELVCE